MGRDSKRRSERPVIKGQAPRRRLSRHARKRLLAAFLVTLERLSRSRREAIEALGVNVEPGSPAKVRAFVRELGVSFLILLDPDLAVGKLYRVGGLPTSFVVDREGVVRFREIGYGDWTDAESQFVLDQALRAR